MFLALNKHYKTFNGPSIISSDKTKHNMSNAIFEEEKNVVNIFNFYLGELCRLCGGYDI